MISYHPASAKAPVGQHFTRGFLTVDTNDPKRLARGIVSFAWSPSVFRDGYRSKANFLFADWLALDFEDPEFSLDDAVKSFSDMIHVIGTTRNHQVSKDGAPPIDRFRVLLRLGERTGSLRDYEWTLRRIGRRYPIDMSCVDGARHFYPCRAIVSISSSGYSEDLEIAPLPLLPEERLARLAAYRSGGVLTRDVAHALIYGVPQGRRSNTCYWLGCRFAELGFSLEEALSRTLASPLAAIGIGRLTGSVTNGFRRSQADMEALYGGNRTDQSRREEQEEGANQ